MLLKKRHDPHPEVPPAAPPGAQAPTDAATYATGATVTYAVGAVPAYLDRCKVLNEIASDPNPVRVR